MKIGVLGLIGAGKNTLADYLCEELEGFQTTCYAEPLKELTCKVFDITMQDVEDRVIKERPKMVSQEDVMEEVFYTLHTVLKFNDEELDKASKLFCDNFLYTQTISPRKFMQVIGTDVVRAVKQDAWVDYLKNQDRCLVVPDVRFPNEYLDVNVLVTREGTSRTRPNHISEHLAWDLQYGDVPKPPNFIQVQNNGSLEQLREEVELTVQQVLNNL